VLDADKEGFLRSQTSLIQTIGRAARNINGIAILYADVITDSLRHAIDETNRRRAIQQQYNEEHGIEPATIIKAIDSDLVRMSNLDYLDIAGPVGTRKLDMVADEDLDKLSVQQQRAPTCGPSPAARKGSPPSPGTYSTWPASNPGTCPSSPARPTCAKSSTTRPPPSGPPHNAKTSPLTSGYRRARCSCTATPIDVRR